MRGVDEWRWKIERAVERIRTRYDHIGRKSAAPFLAVVYPPDAEEAFLGEWRTHALTLEPQFSVRSIDALAATSEEVQRLGLDMCIDVLRHPMAGTQPDVAIGTVWLEALAARVAAVAAPPSPGRPVVVLERLAALYPAATPYALMQRLWDAEDARLEVPIVLLIPGVLVEARTYDYLGCVRELMYRGDIL